LPPLLEVRDLQTEFRTGAGVVPAVDGISYTVERGEAVAIVGESGSGKTAGALSILRLIPDPPGRITQGQICLPAATCCASPMKGSGKCAAPTSA
jgi:oligopeptide transport system ATP-binding protein